MNIQGKLSLVRGSCVVYYFGQVEDTSQQWGHKSNRVAKIGANLQVQRSPQE